MDPIGLRPRKATEIVDAAIEVYRRNPLHFMLLTTLVHAPWLILQIILLGDAPATSNLGTQLMISAGSFVSYFFMAAIVVQMASDLYLGRETDAFDAIRRVGSRIPRAFLAALGKGLLIAFGLALFLFPAVYWSALYFAVIPVVVLEGKSVGASFSRSGELSRELKLHILSTLGLVFVIRVAIALGVGILIALIPNVIVQRILSTLLTIVVYPLIGITDALLYYDARIRREGFDIEMMAASTAQPEAVAI